ncbi:MAG: glycosyltransferase family 1 protein [Planctomycetes bacterium]|nr:glycosyltransferase family 1 protein [Planctomycetota bacterium]
MQPRVLVIDTYYSEFLAELYAQDPGLANLPSDEQYARLFRAAFGTSDAYADGLRRLGCEALQVICNADAAQERWAVEHGVRPSGNPHDRRRRIIEAQVRDFRPDVVYVFEWSPLGDAFLADLRNSVRLLVGELSSSARPDRTYAAYDLMVSSWPPMVENFRRKGTTAEYVRLCFDARLLDSLERRPPCYDVTFVGGLSPAHAARIELLEKLADEHELAIFGYGIEHTATNSPIRRRHQGPVWGRRMYQVLQQSRITLNVHGRIEVDGATDTAWANNMRLYEATGVGALLLTDWRPHLNQLFDPEREVATFRDPDDCAARIRYYLSHEAEREAVARAGQVRTLREHCCTDRMQELLATLQRHLAASRGARRATTCVP